MRQYLVKLECNSPATEEEILTLERHLGMTLPSDFGEFLRIANGAEGFVGESSFLRMLSAQEIPGFNELYNVKAEVPGLVLFGSNGSVGAYGFDTRTRNLSIVEMPFDSMRWKDAMLAGNSFTEFLQILQNAG